MKRARASRAPRTARTPGLFEIVDIVTDLATPDAAALFQALAKASPKRLETLTVARLADLAGFAHEDAVARIEKAESILSGTFTLNVLRIETSGWGRTSRSSTSPTRSSGR